MNLYFSKSSVFQTRFFIDNLSQKYAVHIKSPSRRRPSMDSPEQTGHVSKRYKIHSTKNNPSNPITSRHTKTVSNTARLKDFVHNNSKCVYCTRAQNSRHERIRNVGRETVINTSLWSDCPPHEFTDQ